MRLGIKGKQVVGVTSIVVVVVVVLSVLNLARLAKVSLDESQARAELLANAVYHRAQQVVVGGAEPLAVLRADPGLRSILESSLYSKNVTYAALVDVHGVAVAHADRSLEGQPLPPAGDLGKLLERPALSQLRAIYSSQGQNLEYRGPLLLGDTEIGSTRIGVSTLLIRQDLDQSLRPALVTAFIALAVSVLLATLLSQLFLKPIHMIRSGLTRLGKGEFGVQLNLNQQDEFGELGTFFNTVSEQLSADRTQMAGQVANLESAVEQLEDAVAIVNARGELLFTNPAMRTLLPQAAPGGTLEAVLPADHPLRRLSEQTYVSRQSRGPLSAPFGDSGERLVMTHAINDPKGDLVGIMLIARNMEYLSEVQSTVRYSHKLAALGRLSAGVAHEVKNPLNAMTIHLELLRQKLGKAQPVIVGAASPQADARGFRLQAEDSLPAQAGHQMAQGLMDNNVTKHVDIIGKEIQRLDQVVGGFLKFARPDELKLQPIHLTSIISDVTTTVAPEAEQMRISIKSECPRELPEINADPAMLGQAILNLALNGCQAMPNGGTLKLSCRSTSRNRVEVDVEDTGVGIPPEHLQKIFDLYFTTKEKGSGIGLSMVYRIVQLHDGEVEVQSTPGVGTTFRLIFPQA